jgi:hypothetical protein
MIRIFLFAAVLFVVPCCDVEAQRTRLLGGCRNCNLGSVRTSRIVSAPVTEMTVTESVEFAPITETITTETRTAPAQMLSRSVTSRRLGIGGGGSRLLRPFAQWRSRQSLRRSARLQAVSY